jgi:hypothetical protein
MCWQQALEEKDEKYEELLGKKTFNSIVRYFYIWAKCVGLYQVASSVRLVQPGHISKMMGSKRWNHHLGK